MALKNLDDVYEQIFRLAGAQENMGLQLEQFRQDFRGLDCKAHATLLEVIDKRLTAVETHTGVSEAVKDVVKEVTGKFRIPQSSGEQPATVNSVASALEKRDQQRKRDRRNSLAQWVGIVVGLIMILTTLGGVLAYVSKLSRKLDAQPDEMRSLIAAQGQRVVYVTVPQHVDAGTEPAPLPPPKRLKKR